MPQEANEVRPGFVLIELWPRAGRRHVLRPVTTLGRDSSNDVALPDPTVSRRHALVKQHPDGTWVLLDLGSTQGTTLDGERIAESALRPGSEIALGRVRLRVEPVAPPALNAGGASPTKVLAIPALPLPETTFRPVREIQAQEDVRPDYEKLRIAFELARSLSREGDLHAMLERVLEVALWVFGADLGALFLLDDAGEFTLRLGRARDGQPAALEVPSSVMRELVQSRAAILSVDAGIDPRFARSDSVHVRGVRSFMTAPLLDGTRVRGVLHLESHLLARAFDASDLELVAFLAAQASMALRSLLLTRELDAARAANRQQLERLVAKLPIGVALVDSRGNALTANPAAEAFLRAAARRDEAGAIIGLGVHEWAACRDSAESVRVEVPGTPFASRFDVGLSPAEANEFLLVARDVSFDSIRAEATLRQERLALIGQLASGVVHDVNNILQVLMHSAQRLGAELEETHPLHSEVVVVEREVERIRTLMRQILAFAGRQEASRVVRFHAVLHDLDILMRRSIGAHIELIAKPGKVYDKILAAPSRLEQMLLNLVVNARDALPKGGRITLTTEERTFEAPRSGPELDLDAGRYLRVVVADNGTGMTPEVAARAFDPFFSTKENGTGLGLANVYAVVKECGGAVGLETEPGRGTTFEIFLPLADG